EEVEFQGSEFTFPVNGSIFRTLSKPRLCVRVHAVVTIGSWEKETEKSTEECAQFSREELNTLLLVQLLLLSIFIILVTAVGYYFTMQYLHVANDRLPFVLADLLPDEGSDKHPTPGSHHGPPAARPCHEPDSHPISVVAVVDCPRSGYDRVAICAVAHDCGRRGSPSEGFPRERRRPPNPPPPAGGRAREMVAGRGGRGRGETGGEPGPVVGRDPARRRRTRHGHRRAPAGGRRLFGRRHAAVGGRGGATTATAAAASASTGGATRTKTTTAPASAHEPAGGARRVRHRRRGGCWGRRRRRAASGSPSALQLSDISSLFAPA
ncbi:unnamed protein product, partial [Lampetra planeri]